MIETLVDHVREWAEQTPAESSLIYLADGETPLPPLTFAHLHARAETIAARLLEVAAPGDRALLLYPPGIEYVIAFMACLYARVIAVPAYPPDVRRLEQSAERLTLLARDAEPAAILTDAEVRPATALIDLSGLAVEPTVLVTDDGEEPRGLPARHRAPRASEIAFVQYTSGSTSDPKGVVMSHENVLRQINLIIAPYDFVLPGEVACSWLPPYHDMGLIGMILCALRCGNPLYLMSPLDFLQKPYRWVRAMSDYRARITAGPNFAFKLCTRKVSEEELATLDLSAWEVAINGAEPIDPLTLAEFTEYFGRAGLPSYTLRPAYGLAEAGLMVTIGTYEGPRSHLTLDKAALQAGRAVAAVDRDAETVEVVCEGSPVADLAVRIVSPESGAALPEDEVGEIWVAGSSVGDGYWDREEETEAVFGGRLEGDDRRFLRTGDLGFLHDGRLYVTGRLKDVLIVGGRNIYPHDVEAAVAAVDARLRTGCGVAVGGRDDRGGGVMILQEVRAATDSERGELMAGIRRVLFDQFRLTPELVALVPPHTIPKTSSGKLQRARARGAFLDGGIEAVSLWTAPAARGGAPS